MNNTATAVRKNVNLTSAMIKLDFVTIKPFGTLRIFLFTGLLALFITVTSGNISNCLGIGMMLQFVFVGYPFAMAERTGMDNFYTSLAVPRATVVRARYMFAIIVNLCGFAYALALAGIGTAVSAVLGKTVEWSSAGFIAIIFIVYTIFEMMQLPVFFKFGYSKAKLFNFILGIMVVSFFVGISRINSADTAGSVSGAAVSEVFDFNSFALIISIFIVVLCLIVAASYNLSAAFYKKREF